MEQTDFDHFIAALAQDLQKPLPGRSAQYNMAPRPRSGGEEADQPRPDARHSSVLILFYPRFANPHGLDSHSDQQSDPHSERQRSRIYFPLILRPTSPGVHSGQIGLPGGGNEPQDGDLLATALREAQEEIGVAPEDVTIIGTLSKLYIRPSNHLVLPVVGWTPQRPNFKLDPREVAALIEAPLDELLNPANQRTERWRLHDRTADVPIFDVQDQIVWGATAMILSELLALPTLIAAANRVQPNGR